MIFPEFLKRKKSLPEQEFDKEIFLGPKYTKTLIPQFASWHNYLQIRSIRYYSWHLKPQAKIVHWFTLILTIVILAAIVFGILFIYPKATQAVTLTIRPEANGDINQWAAVGCAVNWDCVDEDPHDSNTTYVTSFPPDAPRQDLYNLQDTSQTGAISSITVYFVARSFGYVTPPTVGAIIKEGGTTTEGAQQALTGSYATYSQVWSANPRTSAAWQWLEINSLQAGVKDNARVFGAAEVTQLYVVVNYTALAAPFLTTQAASNIGQTAADAKGTITATGGENASTRGFKYYQSSNCSGAESDRSEAGSFGNGAYSLQLTGLSTNTNYSYKAYATNSGGTGYGSCVSFTTLSGGEDVYYTLTVSKSGTGSGTVTSSPAGINCGADCNESYLRNTSVTLTASAFSGSNFVEWSGVCSGTTSTCIVAMDNNKSVTATFNALPATKWCELEGGHIPEQDWSEERCVLPAARWCEKEQQDIPETEWSEERCVPPGARWCELEGIYIPENEWSEDRCLLAVSEKTKWCKAEKRDILEADWTKERCAPPIISVKDVQKIIQPVKEVASKTVQKTKEFLQNPTGSKITKIVSSAGLATGGAAIASGFLFFPTSFTEGFLFLLRLLGAIMTAFGLKKRVKPWGTVYDSVTKQPLDPVYVILQDLEGKEIASSITDLDGRYGFLVSPGKYQIIARKTNYKFPSQKLFAKTKDELYNDLYFGQEIEVKEVGEVITKNIPLDPEKFDWNEFAKRKKNLLKFYSQFDLFLRRLSSLLFVFGFFASIIAVIFVPYPYNFVILGLYVFLLILRLLGLKPKTYGLILEEKTGFPLSFAIVRVFSAELGKEMFSRVTDKFGRYYILVPKGIYFLKIEQKNEDGSYSLIYISGTINAQKGIIQERFIV